VGLGRVGWGIGGSAALVVIVVEDEDEDEDEVGAGSVAVEITGGRLVTEERLMYGVVGVMGMASVSRRVSMGVVCWVRDGR
jgi:hypothetical protein